MLLKRLYWELRDRAAQRELLYECVRNVPGELGSVLRSAVLRNAFKSRGHDVVIPTGCRIVSIKNLEVGDGVRLGVDTYIQASGGVRIGKHTLLGPGVKIWSVNHRFEDLETPIREQGFERLPVSIGDHVWIGANAFIMPGTVIGDHCIISAGAIVGAKNYPPRSILAGNPARKIGVRGD